MILVNSVLNAGAQASARYQVVGPFSAVVMGAFAADMIVLKKRFVGDGTIAADPDAAAVTVQTFLDSFGVNGTANDGLGWEYWFEAINLTSGTPTVRLCVPEPRLL